MAVDYGNKQATTVAPKVDGPVTSGVVNVPADSGIVGMDKLLGSLPPYDPPPTEIEVFLALLTAHTMFSGGVKYWAVERNIPSNVALLKKRAKQIVEAY